MHFRVAGKRANHEPIGKLFFYKVIMAVMKKPDYALNRQEFLSFLEKDAKLRIDGFIEDAIEVAEEVHHGVTREDGVSLFLETHTWPVAADVVKHYRSVNRTITSVEVASAILHDILEDNDRILDSNKTKEYGFEAYLSYRFGSRVQDIATQLRIRPLENFAGAGNEERELNRFREYCDILISSEYDVKTIKLADRLNNMKFILDIAQMNRQVIYDKIKRYLREGEDFYLAYTMLQPKLPRFYTSIRSTYERLRSMYYEQTLTMPQSQ
jgi:(p)ppGpp synthase/HD superfamily hydrolase